MSNLEDARRKIEALREQRRRSANPARERPQADDAPVPSPPLAADPVALAEEDPLGIVDDDPIPSLEEDEDPPAVDLPQVPEGD
jgi:hypothetical protein